MKRHLQIFAMLLLGLTAQVVTAFAENAEVTYTVWHGRRGGEYGNPVDIFKEIDPSYLEKDNYTMQFITPPLSRTDLSSYCVNSGQDGDATAVHFKYVPTEDFPLFYIYFAQEEYVGFSGHTNPFVSIHVICNGDTIGCRYDHKGTADGMDSKFRIDTEHYGSLTNYYRPWDMMPYDFSAYIGDTITIEAIATCCSNVHCWNRLYLAFERMQVQDICSTCDSTVLIAPSYSNPTWIKGSPTGEIVGADSVLVVYQEDIDNYYCYIKGVCNEMLFIGQLLDVHPQFTYKTICSGSEARVEIQNTSYMQYRTPPYAKIPCDTAFWEFGDGRTSTDINLSEIVYNTDGQYTITLTTGKKGFTCKATDSIVVPFGLQHYTNLIDTICQEDLPYIWREKEYRTTGDYTDTLVASTGCDSVLHLLLTVLDTTTSFTTYSICKGERIRWNGKIYSEEGTYRDTLVNVAGCDSLLTLTITYKDCPGPSGEGQDSIDHPINPMPFLPIRDTLDTTICEHTSLFYREKWYSEPGTYNDTLRYWFGPDSIIYTLILDTKCCDCETYSVLDTTIIFDTLQVHPLDWFGETYIMPGIYQDTIHGGNTQGGDSIGSLLLRVIYEDSARVCNDDPYTFTTPWGEFTTPDGCDCLTGDIVKTADNESIVWAQLCVTRLQPTDSTTIATICEGETFNWYGRIYKASKDTTMKLTNAAGCDSVCTLHLTVLPKTYSDTVASTCSMPYYWHGKQANDGDTIILKNANGCDSIVTLRLTVLQPTDSTTIATICEGETFNWYGHIYKESKDTAMTLTNAAGCDSICTLKLTVLPKTYKDTVASTCSMPYYWHGKQANDGDTIVLKNANGCDSIVTLRLTVLQPTDSTTIATICEGETFNWYGRIYKENKDTAMTLTNAAGCDSICTLHLTVLPVTRQRFGRSICEGTTTTWRGRVLDKAGTYDTILYYVNGCDSIRDTLDLTIDEMYRDSVAYKICQGEHITWRGNTYTNAGDYSEHAIGKNGDCDSILKLHIDVALPTRLDTALYRCYSDPFPFNWEGHSIKRVGDTVLHTTNKAGCDSAIYVTVYQSPEPYTIEEDSSFCDGSYIENWHGKQIWNGGTYYATEKCKNPHFATCDSINYVLHVTKKYPTHGDTTVYVCACEMPITWDFQGQKRTLAAPGTYNIRTLTNVVGCDSTLSITIVVSDKVKTDIIDTTLCEGSSIQWQGRTIDQEGHYYDTTKCKDIHFLRCDSIYHELHVTIAQHSDSVTYATICRGETFEWRGETYTETTHRTITIDNAAGCDSVCTLHLTVNEPSSSLTTASICMGQIYKWNGYSFTNSVDTTIQLLNSVGCDSLCRLVLTAAVCCPDTQMRRTVIPSMCDTLLPYQWQTWRTQPILINDPGSYADTLRNKWGCDSIIYTLDIDFHHCCRDLKGEMNVGDVCADDDYLSLSLDLHSGMMNEYRLHFTNPTLNKMPIRDTVVHLSEEDWATGTIHIDIPIPHDPEDSTRYPRPDNYFVDVLVSDSCGNTLRWEQVPFTIFYPSWLILQRWNDVLALYNEKYNGGYTFSQIRWFHEDTLLTARGEHDGYIYIRPTLEYGTPYYAELTRTDDGKTFPTCAYFPRPQRDTIIFKEEVEISHNLIGPGANRIGVKTNTNGTYDIYDIGGHCVQHGYFGAEHDALYIDFNTRLPEGVYILLFRGKELLQPEKLIHDKE